MGMFDFGSGDVVQTISTAGRERKRVTIVYTDMHGETSTRDTEPYEIKGGSYWGYCMEKGGIRQFLLSGISSATKTSNTYDPRWEVKF